MADYLFIDDDGKKEYLMTADIYNKTTKKGLIIADKCADKGFNEDGVKQGLYCICQGENAKIKMSIYRRGDHVVITSHHRIDTIRHMKGICRHARNDDGKPYDSAYEIDNDGVPVYKIKDIPSVKKGEDMTDDITYTSRKRDIFDPDKKLMSPTEFIREVLIECHRNAMKNKKTLTSKYFYGTLVNSIIAIEGSNKGTFIDLLHKGKLTNKDGYRDNKVIIFGPIKNIEIGKNAVRVNLKTGGKAEKYIQAFKEYFLGAEESFYKRYGIKLSDERTVHNYNIVCFAITGYNTQRPLWLSFHLVSADGCYCDNLFELKAYGFMNKFILKSGDEYYYYKPFRPEGGDYMGEGSLVPAAYLIKRETGEKLAIIDVFDGTDHDIKERKRKSAQYQMITYDTDDNNENSWAEFYKKICNIGKING